MSKFGTKNELFGYFDLFRLEFENNTVIFNIITLGFV